MLHNVGFYRLIFIRGPSNTKQVARRYSVAFWIDCMCLHCMEDECLNKRRHLDCTVSNFNIWGTLTRSWRPVASFLAGQVQTGVSMIFIIKGEIPMIVFGPIAFSSSKFYWQTCLWFILLPKIYKPIKYIKGSFYLYLCFGLYCISNMIINRRDIQKK